MSCYVSLHLMAISQLDIIIQNFPECFEQYPRRGRYVIFCLTFATLLCQSSSLLMFVRVYLDIYFGTSSDILFLFFWKEDVAIYVKQINSKQ